MKAGPFEGPLFFVLELRYFYGEKSTHKPAADLSSGCHGGIPFHYGQQHDQCGPAEHHALFFHDTGEDPMGSVDVSAHHYRVPADMGVSG